MTDQKIEPCPFCGKTHTAKIATAQELAEQDSDYDGEFWEHAASFAVICDAHRPGGPGGCGASGGFFPTEAEAIAAWNTRALAQPQAQQAKTCHDSDCAVNNAPALPVGPCDCGFEAQQAAAVPAGFKLVPIDPTPEMVDAGNKARLYREHGSLELADVLSARTYNTKQAYTAMLAAAPPPPVLPLSAWLPIESAPKDGTKFLGYRRGEVATSFYVPRDDCEMWSFGNESGAFEHWPRVRPTHWQPLPAPPITEPGAGGESGA